MKRFIITVVILLMAHGASAQTLEWDPPDGLQDGSPVPVGEVVKYRVYAGDTQTTLTERAAELTVPSVDMAVLALAPTDKWLAVEAYSDQRIGIRSVEKQLPVYQITFSLKIVQTLP